MREECLGRSPGDDPLTLTRCHGYMKRLKGGRKCVCGHESIKGKFLSLSVLF